MVSHKRRATFIFRQICTDFNNYDFNNYVTAVFQDKPHSCVVNHNICEGVYVFA